MFNSLKHFLYEQTISYYFLIHIHGKHRLSFGGLTAFEMYKHIHDFLIKYNFSLRKLMITVVVSRK